MFSPQHRRTHHLVLVALVLALLTAACGGDGSDAAADEGGGRTTSTGAPSAAKGPTVAAKSMAFKPAKLEVAVGETVTWRFDDGSIAHNVVGDGLQSALERSGTYAHTFDEAGTYDYRCTIHPNMKGTVVVS